MSIFTHYTVTYTLDDDPTRREEPCMTVEGETTTDDFAKMIGAKLFGRAEEGDQRIAVIEFKETGKA
ncbi:hypothetical protein [Amycolatopsis kentuckyensis]|uniref:hypothetical protein n=1 Tax=Amycolatopsis kentuckyensis TaxID=218823 RepID=UPI0035659388